MKILGGSEDSGARVYFDFEDVAVVDSFVAVVGPFERVFAMIFLWTYRTPSILINVNLLK
jgi:hypothetical protein